MSSVRVCPTLFFVSNLFFSNSIEVPSLACDFHSGLLCKSGLHIGIAFDAFSFFFTEAPVIIPLVLNVTQVPQRRKIKILLSVSEL